MEEKNNATEKVENLASQENDQSLKNTVEANQMAENSNEEAKRVERALMMEKRREELALIRQAKKAEKKEREEKMKRDREKRLEEKQKRKEALKNENALQKAERLSREKEERKQKKAEKMAELSREREEMLRLKRERLKAKKELKAQKRELKYQEKRDKRSRGVGGWIAAVVTLSSLVLVLSALFTYTLVSDFGGKDMFENTIERSFYDLVGYVDNIDVNLSKMMVSNDESEQQRLLGDITTQASLASDKLSELPLQDESKYYTMKFVNQVADFSKYLDNKLIDGLNLSKTDWENLQSMAKINDSLKSELDTLASRLGENYKFTSLMAGEKENAVLDSFVTLEKGAVDYPKLIYDGPFSDSLDTDTAKNIEGEEISATEALDIFKSTFKDYNFETVEVKGEVDGKITCYQIEGMLDSESSVSAEISKQGGKIVMFDCYKDCNVTETDIDTCVEIANEFLKGMELDNMKAVWATESSAVVYINYAYEENGVIIYPDMVKITVCQERGIVSSFDATEYYLNHKEREIEKPAISKKQALEKMSQNLDVDSVRLCQIPKGEGKESLAYEISGTFNGVTYYVYIDAKTGKETQIFRVVETTEGTLLV